MTVTELKHQARLQEWHDRILECRSSGLGVKHWCRENQLTVTTYYRWEREIFGKAQRDGSGEIVLVPTATYAELAAPASKEFGSSNTPVIATVRVGNAEVDVYPEADAKVVEAICRALKSC